MNSLQVVDSVRNAQPGKLRHNEHSDYDDESTHSTKIAGLALVPPGSIALRCVPVGPVGDGVFTSVGPVGRISLADSWLDSRHRPN